jgi:hypothetical protein
MILTVSNYTASGITAGTATGAAAARVFAAATTGKNYILYEKNCPSANHELDFMFFTVFVVTEVAVAAATISAVAAIVLAQQ